MYFYHTKKIIQIDALNQWGDLLFKNKTELMNYRDYFLTQTLLYMLDDFLSGGYEVEEQCLWLIEVLEISLEDYRKKIAFFQQLHSLGFHRVLHQKETLEYRFTEVSYSVTLESGFFIIHFKCFDIFAELLNEFKAKLLETHEPLPEFYRNLIDEDYSG